MSTSNKSVIWQPLSRIGPSGQCETDACHITITCSPPRSSSVKTKGARAREGRGEKKGEREREGAMNKSQHAVIM